MEQGAFTYRAGPPAARPAAVVIGASAGAVEALTALLPGLPADYPLPLAVVVHLPPDRESVLAELFASRCALKVKEAEDKELLNPGTVYFAPPNYHLQVEPDARLSLSSDEAVLYSRPSIDVLFETAADACGRSLAGVILTGANSDGANGLARIGAAGGIALVQDPATAVSGTMPQAALDRCPRARRLDLAGILSVLKTEIPAALTSE